jgi:hypothetical protein
MERKDVMVKEVVLVHSLRELPATGTGISLAVLAIAVEIDFNV